MFLLGTTKWLDLNIETECVWGFLGVFKLRITSLITVVYTRVEVFRRVDQKVKKSESRVDGA